MATIKVCMLVPFSVTIIFVNLTTFHSPLFCINPDVTNLPINIKWLFYVRTDNTKIKLFVFTKPLIDFSWENTRKPKRSKSILRYLTINSYMSRNINREFVFDKLLVGRRIVIKSSTIRKTEILLNNGCRELMSK